MDRSKALGAVSPSVVSGGTEAGVLKAMHTAVSPRNVEIAVTLI